MPDEHDYKSFVSYSYSQVLNRIASNFWRDILKINSRNNGLNRELERVINKYFQLW